MAYLLNVQAGVILDIFINHDQNPFIIIFYIQYYQMEKLMKEIINRIILMHPELHVQKIYQNDPSQSYNRILTQNFISKICKKNKTSSHINNSIIQKYIRSKNSRWTFFQDFLYLNFLKQKIQLFKSQNQKRSSRVFFKLSRYMKGLKNHVQCKSHHQKMVKAAKTNQVSKIIAYLQNKYSNEQNRYKKWRESFKEQQKTKESENKQGSKIELDISQNQINIKCLINIDQLMFW